MPRKKKASLPADLEDLLADEPQDDLRADDEKQANTLSNEDVRSLDHAYRLVASTREGIAVLQHILAVTGYKAPLITFSKETFELNQHASIYNLSKRDVWLQVQKRLPAQLLREIENPLEDIRE